MLLADETSELEFTSTKLATSPQSSQSPQMMSFEPVIQPQPTPSDIDEGMMDTIGHVKNNGNAETETQALDAIALTNSQMNHDPGEKEVEASRISSCIDNDQALSLGMMLGGTKANSPGLALDATHDTEQIMPNELKLLDLQEKPESSTPGRDIGQPKPSAVHQAYDPVLVKHSEQSPSVGSPDILLTGKPLRDFTNRLPKSTQYNQRSIHPDRTSGPPLSYFFERANGSLQNEQRKPRVLRKPGIPRSERAGALDKQQPRQTSITASKTCSPKDLTGGPKAWAMKQNPSPLKDRIGLFKALSRNETETEPSESAKG